MEKVVDNVEDIRRKNLKILKDEGINPYPSSANRTHMIDKAVSDFKKLTGENLVLCGRIRLMRRHGRAIFAQMEDETGIIQLFFSEQEVGKKSYKILKSVEVGDFLQTEGSLFLTKKGEKTLLVKTFKILSKALKPLPEKWHGLKDEEERLRKRYLDLIFNPELKEIFKKKALFWQNIREYLVNKGFLEVETPVLEVTPGGADAKPFITHHNALNIDLYLRISMGELWQKRLMVAGFDRTFEIGRQFRNEGIDTEHLQDYTQMEFYMAYANYLDGMKLTEDLYKDIIKKTFGTLKFNIRGYKVDFNKKWEKLDYVSIIKKNFDINVLESSESDLREKCKSLDIDIDEKIGKGRLIDTLWKKIRKDITGPAFLINHPVEVSPLSKRKEDDQRLVERFQIIIAGSELGNGYSELNDPIDQKKRFEMQAELRQLGDEEAQMHDEEFVEALEYGMPPTCGFGLSERLFSFLVDKPIREIVLFPLMRPRNKNVVQIDKEDGDSISVSLSQANNILKEYLKEEKNILHSRETEVIMRALAKRLNKNENLWGTVGLLHDLDWEKTVKNPEKHTQETAEILEQINFPRSGIDAIKAHNYEHTKGKPRTTLLDFGLTCAESVTGLIFAAALMQPNKKLAEVKTSSIKKKFKDKSFAANIDRRRILECEKLGLTLDEFFEISLGAMKEIANELGL